MKKNLFGTDGIREIMGHYPLTATALPALGHAIAQWAKNHCKAHPSILLAHDTRSSCYFIKAALKSGLLLHSVKVYDVLALPTPAACLLTRNNKSFDCGVIITASHNPYQYNGIKLVNANGSKISLEDEKEISELFEQALNTAPTYESLGTDYRIFHAGAQYLDVLSGYFKEQFLEGKTIALDCAHGATSSLAPHIFRMFGAHVITINDKPTGVNINKESGALYPEKLQQIVLENNADAGFAFDGDGDRVVAINRHGEIKDGDDILAILSLHPMHAKSKAIVGTLFSNQGLEYFANQHKKEFIRVNIGDKYVAQELAAKQLSIGAEPSGHIIIREYLESSDGIFTALQLFETIMHHNNWDMESFKHYPHVQINVPIKTKKDLNTSPFAELISESKNNLQNGRLIIRYSGTENVIRIMLEAEDLQQADKIGSHLAQELGKLLTI